MRRCRSFALTLALAAACTSDDSMTAGGSGDDDGQSASAGSSDDGGNDGSAAQLCVDTINMYRATLNLPPYARWTDAEDCAGSQAQMDSASMTAHGAFGMCGEFAQNECPDWPAPPESSITGCLDLMWMEGPGEPFSEHGHYINMSSTQYTKVACGFYVKSDGSYWAAQDFQ